MGHLASDLQQFIYLEVHSVLEAKKMVMEKPKVRKEKMKDGTEHYTIKAGNVEIHFFSETHIFVVGAIVDGPVMNCSASLKAVW
jgi:hypothetical protein